MLIIGLVKTIVFVTNMCKEKTYNPMQLQWLKNLSNSYFCKSNYCITTKYILLRKMMPKKITPFSRPTIRKQTFLKLNLSNQYNERVNLAKQPTT